MKKVCVKRINCSLRPNEPIFARVCTTLYVYWLENNICTPIILYILCLAYKIQYLYVSVRSYTKHIYYNVSVINDM